MKNFNKSLLGLGLFVSCVCANGSLTGDPLEEIINQKITDTNKFPLKWKIDGSPDNKVTFTDSGAIDVDIERTGSDIQLTAANVTPAEGTTSGSLTLDFQNEPSIDISEHFGNGKSAHIFAKATDSAGGHYRSTSTTTINLGKVINFSILSADVTTPTLAAYSEKK